MAIEKSIKRDVWRNIFRLILPYKKKFIWVVILSLLSTGASLIEPLIYREAINDVAGLFVKQAKEDVRKEMGVPTEEEGLVPLAGEKGTAPVIKDTLHKQKNIAKAKNTKTKKKKPKEPHTQTHVASRTPEQALETLLWSAGLLFLINLIRDRKSTRLNS